MSSHSYGFYLSPWQSNKSVILSVRRRVLIDEFAADPESISHLHDPESFHVIAYDGDSNAIGVGCMSQDGVIGHVVVLKKWRRRTIGKAIVAYLINIAKSKNLACTTVTVTTAILPFYLALNFEKTDVSVSLQGIQYQKLLRLLSPSPRSLH